MAEIRTFHVEINLNNSTMRDYEDIAFALERLARSIREVELQCEDNWPVIDRDGAKVGFCGTQQQDPEEYSEDGPSQEGATDFWCCIGK
jgi:hypothetical protein